MNKNYFVKFRKGFLALFITIQVLPMSVLGAEVQVFTGLESVRPDQLFEIQLYLDTENEVVNAINGRLSFSEATLEVIRINKENSILSFWADEPELNSNQIEFAGIIPGGFIGKKGVIFSLTVRAKSKNIINVYLSQIDVLAHDGLGTKLNVKTTGVVIPIDPNSKLQDYLRVERRDTSPPEPFDVLIISDQAIFEGDYTLIFQTTDKQSGIDYYEVSEGGGKFVKSKSPHRLSIQNKNIPIVVRAVDRSGNIRESYLNSKVGLKNLFRITGFTLILLLIIFSYFYYRRKRS